MILKINAFELLAVNSSYYVENTWDRQTMGLSIVLRLYISLKGKFSSFIYVRMIKNYDKSSLFETSAVLGNR